MVAQSRQSGSRLAASLAILLGLSGCGNDNNVGNGQTTSLANNNESIMQSVYNGPRTPNDFYSEPQASGYFYFITHIKSDQITPQANTNDSTPYPLCSDDVNEALQWSDAYAAQLPVYRPLTQNSETELYYQFERQDVGSPSIMQLDRIYKCRFLDPSSQNGPIGKINRLPLKQQDVAWVIEYLWTFSESNHYGNAILSTSTQEDEVSITHSLKEARLVDHEQEGCDSIVVIDSRYRVDKLSGYIDLAQTEEREIATDSNAGSCD